MRARTELLSAAATSIVLTLVLLAIAAIGNLKSQTFDEPLHIASGLEWLQNGRYTFWTETPPVARVAVAMLPYWTGIRLDDRRNGTINVGNAALYRTGDHQRNLAHARLGTLPSFVVLAAVVWSWSRRARLPGAEFITVAMVATIPALVAHAALATTDIAFTAMFLAATYALVRWLERPAPLTTIGLGLGLGAAMATKFSTLLFFPPVAIIICLVRFLWERPAGRITGTVRRVTLANVCTIAGIAMMVVWAGYRFSIGTIAELPPVPGSQTSADGGRLAAVVHRIEHTRLPAPEFAHGLLNLRAHNQRGQESYALGRSSQTGFWYFYPLAIAVKTPIPFLLFTLFGGAAVAAAFRRDADWSSLAALGAVAAILASVTASRVNLGLRHVLAIYPFLAIAAGLGAASMMRNRVRTVRIGTGVCLAVLVAAQLITLWRIHPDELAYFNVWAGPSPGTVLTDSDLDWGQDLAELQAIVRELPIDRLHIAYFGTARLCDAGLPPLTWLPQGEPTSGWIAVSETYFRGAWRVGRRDVCDVAGGWTVPPAGADYSWLSPYQPVAMAGKSIRLYHIP